MLRAPPAGLRVTTRRETVHQALALRVLPLFKGRRFIDRSELEAALLEALPELLNDVERQRAGDLKRLVDECFEELARRGGTPS